MDLYHSYKVCMCLPPSPPCYHLDAHWINPFAITIKLLSDGASALTAVASAFLVAASTFVVAVAAAEDGDAHIRCEPAPSV